VSWALVTLVQVDMHARWAGVRLEGGNAELKKIMVESCSSDFRNHHNENLWGALLAEAGFEHEREVQFLDDGYKDFMAIDYVCRERKIAVEFDGPAHYLTELKEGAKRNHGRENRRTKAKRRLMRQMGKAVVNVDYKDDIKTGLEWGSQKTA